MCSAYARLAHSRPVRPADVGRVAGQHGQETVEDHGTKLHVPYDTDSGAEDPRGSETQFAHQNSTVRKVQMPAL